MQLQPGIPISVIPGENIGNSIFLDLHFIDSIFDGSDSGCGSGFFCSNCSYGGFNTCLSGFSFFP